MTADDLMTDDAKLMTYLLRSGLAHTARDVARQTGVDPEYAEQALARMADYRSDWQVIRRPDLGADVYEAIEDSARDGS